MDSEEDEVADLPMSNQKNTINIPKPGNLTVYANFQGIVSVYSSVDEKLTRQYESHDFKGRKELIKKNHDTYII